MIKKKKLLRTCVTVAAVLVVCFFAQATQANTIYVGSCHTNSYATITIALTHATMGTIIDVCPGYYAEQVTITLSGITLHGVAYSHSGVTSDAAVIVPPSTGLVQNGEVIDLSEGGPALAQILVNGATDVTIKNIVVDAQSNQTCGSGNIIGIYYENSSGTVTDSVARNQNEGGGNGDQCGWGIAVESTSALTVNVTNSSVHNFQKNGIVARGINTAGPTLTATGNTVIGVGPVANNAAQNGIEIAYGATGSVKSNYVADMLDATYGGQAAGILLYGTTGSPTVEINTVESANTGISVDYDSSIAGSGSDATISSNHIGGTNVFDAIDLCGANEIAKLNLIYNSTQSGIHLDDTCGGSSGTGDTVTNNTVNEACAGLLLGTSLTNTTTPNTYFNDGYEQLAGDSCTLPTGPTNLAKGKTEGQSAKKAVKPRP